MNRLLSLFVIMSLLATTASAALDPHLQLYGRWDRRDADRAITVNSGSHIVARFAGTGATARFDVSKNRAPFPTIAWRIDDQPWKRGEVAESVELAKGLENKAHALMLFVQDLDEHQPRWSPPLTASVTFLGIDVAEGKLVDPPAEPKLKIEFLGDSITEGVLVHHRQPGKTWPWLGDGRIAYPTQTAERLKAQWRQCGFGALGVTRPGNGGVPAAPDSFNFFYQDCPRDAWEADVVVVNQGTNDGAAAADPFRAAYGKLLDEIRKAYPHAQIAALRPFAGTHAADIAAEVKVRNDAGDTEVYFIDSTGWLESGDFTDGVHPNVRGSGKAADKLAAALRETLKLK